MKTKAVILAVILLSFLSQVLSQDHQLNLEKYWYYRERLKNDFIYYTGDPTMKGSHQPVECRMNYINVNKADYVRMGDATANLGYYIGLLAIEYRLLKDNGQETDETLLELYNALQAYDRLDLNAENCFRDLPINPLPEDWNGFFIRDDMENDTVLQNYFNVTEINSGYDNCCHQNDSNVVSQDQVIRLFLGLRLAQLMVPDEYVQERTIETAHEIITAMYYMYDLFGLGIDVAVWEIKNPITGEVVPLGGQLIELFPLLWAEAESASNITSEIYGSEHRSWSNSNLTITAWKDAQCNIVNLIQGTIEIEFEIMLYVLGFPVLPFGRITWTEEVGPFNSAMVEELSLLTNDWVQGQDNNLYEWFCGICENTEELYNMPEDVGIFPQFPLLAKLMYGYNGPELIPADYYKIHFFDTAPPCGAHNYKFDERDDITAPPWHTLSLFSPWHNYYNGSVFDGDYNMMDYMMMYTAYLYDYYDDPQPYTLVTLDYPERSRDSKTNSISLKKAKSTGQDRNPYPDIIQAPRRIDAVNSLFPDANVWMKAGQEVHLLPGFHAYYGSSLHAYIDPALDMYPVYFTKTTNDPCGQRDYQTQHLNAEDINSALDQCRQNISSYHANNRDSIRKISTSLIEESEKEDLIEIIELNPYPNPSNGMFFVDVQDDYTVQQIEISNNIGEIVHQSEPVPSKTIEIDLGNFPSGVYYLRIISTDNVKIYKLIKK